MNSVPPPLPKPPPGPIGLPLMLAFTPSVIALLLFSLNLPEKTLAAVCVPAVLLSLGCCAVSSVMLFKRNTTATLVFGVLLAMLNVVISLGLGCAVLAGQINLH